MRPKPEQRAFAEQTDRAASRQSVAGRGPARESRGAARDPGEAAAPEGGLSPSTVALKERVQSMRREMSGAERSAGAGGIRPQAQPDDRRPDAVATEGGADRSRAQRADGERLSMERADSIRAARVARREIAPPAVATAAEDLRSRMKVESVRAADTMTDVATQRALRDYASAG